MIIIGLIGCLFLMWASWDVLKDITSPPFILSGIWSLIYAILLLRSKVLDFDNILYLSFFGALLLFCIGFFLVVDHSGKRSDFVNCKVRKLNYRKLPTNLLFVIVLLLLFLLAKKLFFLFSEHYVINPWQTVTHAKVNDGFTIGVLLRYAQNLIVAFMAVSGAILFQNPNRKHRRIFLLLVLAAFVFAFVAGNRGAFFIIILILFLIRGIVL